MDDEQPNPKKRDHLPDPGIEEVIRHPDGSVTLPGPPKLGPPKLGPTPVTSREP